MWLWRSRFDARLAAGESPEASVEMAIRAESLVRPAACFKLARTLDWISGQGQVQAIAQASPIDRRAVLQAQPELAILAARLRTRGPIAARGVAQIRVLLTDGAGPLYAPGQAAELRMRMSLATAALDPHPVMMI